MFSYIRPIRQDNVIYDLPFLWNTKIQTFIIHQKISIRIIEFRDKFFEICIKTLCSLPCALQPTENTIRWSEYRLLQLDHKLWDLSDQEIHDNSRRAIMSWKQIALCTFVFLLEDISVKVLKEEVFKVKNWQKISLSSPSMNICMLLWASAASICWLLQ